jgi:acid phosphatase
VGNGGQSALLTERAALARGAQSALPTVRDALVVRRVPAGSRGAALVAGGGLESGARLPSIAHPCGIAQGKPRVDRVLLIWEENHSYGSVIGSSAAPEINRLARLCGSATHYMAVTHPSLPNYMSMTSGLSYAYPPWDGDCAPFGNCTTKATSIFAELAAKGKEWRSYAESMTSNCSLATYGTYAARHNPAVYYTSIRSQCRKWDQPLGTTSRGALHTALQRGPSVGLTTVTPNVDDDMHNGTVSQADAWLAEWVPQIVGSPSYRKGLLAVVIAWDEGFGGGNEASSAPLLVMSAYTHPGSKASLPLNDYSVLRSVSLLLGVKPLGEAAKATSFVRVFNL